MEFQSVGNNTVSKVLIFATISHYFSENRNWYVIEKASPSAQVYKRTNYLKWIM